MPLSQEQINEWAALCNRATPGPWEPTRYSNGVDTKATGLKSERARGVYGWIDAHICTLNDGMYSEYMSDEEQRANAAFIAIAREAVPALIVEIQNIQEQIRQSRQEAEFHKIERDLVLKAMEDSEKERADNETP